MEIKDIKNIDFGFDDFDFYEEQKRKPKAEEEKTVLVEAEEDTSDIGLVSAMEALEYAEKRGSSAADGIALGFSNFADKINARIKGSKQSDKKHNAKKS